MKSNYALLLFIILLVLGVAAVYYFWYIILVLGMLALLIRLLLWYYWQKYGCVRCGATGSLEGFDPVLQVHFLAGEPCYLCAGNKVPPKDRRLWHDIAKKAMHQLKILGIREEVVLREIERFRQSMKFSARTDEQIVFAHNQILAKKFLQLSAIETETEAYVQVQKQAIINGHNIHLIHLMNRERIGIEHRENQHLDTMSDSLSFIRDSTFLQQSDFIPLLQQQTHDYLPLISEPMRKDIEMAVKDFKNLLQHQGKD